MATMTLRALMSRQLVSSEIVENYAERNKTTLRALRNRDLLFTICRWLGNALVWGGLVYGSLWSILLLILPKESATTAYDTGVATALILIVALPSWQTIQKHLQLKFLEDYQKLRSFLRIEQDTPTPVRAIDLRDLIAEKLRRLARSIVNDEKRILGPSQSVSTITYHVHERERTHGDMSELYRTASRFVALLEFDSYFPASEAVARPYG